MSDIRQTNDGDIAVANNDVVLVTGLEEISQRLTQRLRTFRGEPFLAQDEGVEYFEEVLKKNPNSTIVESIFKREISNTPGVTEIEKFNIERDNSTRVATLSLRAKTISGTLEMEVTP
jgi:hypothetical protein